MGGGVYSRDMPARVPGGRLRRHWGCRRVRLHSSRRGPVGLAPPAECLAGCYRLATRGTIPRMATTPSAPKSPGKVGANFPLSQPSTTVSPAKDRGENRAIPQEHCTARRSANDYGTLGY